MKPLSNIFSGYALSSTPSVASKNPASRLESERATFAGLVENLSSDVYCYAYSLCRDDDLAEELTQEVFLRAWKSLHSLRDPVAAKSWLFTITKREYARVCRRRRPEAPNFDISQLPAEVDFDTRTEAVVLRRALQRLPKEYLEPLVLQVIGGYTLEEIASRLGVSLGAITTRVFRARQKLRKALGGTRCL